STRCQCLCSVFVRVAILCFLILRALSAFLLSFSVVPSFIFSLDALSLPLFCPCPRCRPSFINLRPTNAFVLSLSWFRPSFFHCTPCHSLCSVLVRGVVLYFLNLRAVIAFVLSLSALPFFVFSLYALPMSFFCPCPRCHPSFSHTTRCHCLYSILVRVA